jgi:recombination protein RecR
MERIGHCRRCRTLTDAEICPLCANPSRDDGLLCVVETPTEALAVEQATGFKGRYFVLGGRLSPLDGVGPRELGLDVLRARLAEGAVRELILATNPTVEGAATAHYIGEMAKEAGVVVTRIAHGVPLGGELDYVDGGTLAHAFAGRHRL